MVAEESPEGNSQQTELLAELQRQLYSSDKLRAEVAKWLDEQNALVLEAIDQAELKKPDPLAPIEEQLAYMRQTAQIAARAEVLAELRKLLHRAGDEPVVVTVTSSDLRALQVGAQGLGIREGAWGFDIRLRPGCAQEFVLTPE